MRRARKSRRNAIALALSTTFHVVILALVVNQVSPEYDLPEPPAPPMDVQIMRMPEIPPPPVVILHVPPQPKKTEARKPPEPRPQPPKPEPPKPEPPRPEPPKPEPPKPAPPKPPPPKPEPDKPEPPKPAVKPLPQPVAVKPAPVAAPRPEPKPVTAPPTAAKPIPAPPAPAAPMKLNIHKPDKDAPASVPTLPFAPSPAASGGPTAPAGSNEPPLGGSRLSGLTPYPLGSMPGGGGGLRGTLVGCANAEAVRLSPTERARCNERFGSEAGSAPALDGISPAKRAAFDKAAARQDQNNRYRDSTPTAGTTYAHPLSPDGTTRGPSGVIYAQPPH